MSVGTRYYTSRAQDSPFRETEWDQRLDKMLDDLKTTVPPETENSSSYRDNTLVSNFRSSSRNESRNSNRGVEDAGLMRHHHKEYTSPDKSTRIITDEFEYDTGDPTQSGHYQKKVKKSTYSTYKVTGGISDELDTLRQGPSASVLASAAPDPKVVSASQKVANKLVRALSSIGGDRHNPPVVDTSTLGTSSDYSTLTRINKDINELDTLLEKIEKEEKVKKSRQQQTNEPKIILHQVTDSSRSSSQTQPTPHNIISIKEINTETKKESNSYDDPLIPYHSSPATKLTNGATHTGYDDDMDFTDDGKGGEVRRIVWRNRFEKTYESHDSTSPTVTIEEDARQRMRKQQSQKTSSALSIQPLPPQISPSGQPWADPVPLPTPPQLSPGEPGVAYVYTYAQDSGTKIQHLPPLNFVAAPPTSDGAAAPSPTPSGSTQPIVYHYSYHYTLQPGQQLPDGVPHQTAIASSDQPALQVAPPPRQHPPSHTVSQVTTPHNSTSYNYESHSSHSTAVNRNDIPRSNFSSPSRPGTVGSPVSKGFPRDTDGSSPVLPRRGEPRSPSDGPNTNMSITINKTTTHTTHTKEFGGAPTTSTPTSDRYHRDPNSPTRITTTHVTRHARTNDSLERLKRPYQDSRAFPETSPIRPTSDGHIPRQVDELLTSLDSEDGIDPGFRKPYVSNGLKIKKPVEDEPLLRKTQYDDTEFTLLEKSKKEDSKNLAGPPVYYPPGHHQLFDESMHTMTLKENKRRGNAKWRRERAAASKESASHSDSKGGAAMVPVCLPLCCGAACVLM